MFVVVPSRAGEDRDVSRLPYSHTLETLVPQEISHSHAIPACYRLKTDTSIWCTGPLVLHTLPTLSSSLHSMSRGSAPHRLLKGLLPEETAWVGGLMFCVCDVVLLRCMDAWFSTC